MTGIFLMTRACEVGGLVAGSHVVISSLQHVVKSSLQNYKVRVGSLEPSIRLAAVGEVTEPETFVASGYK